MHNHRSKLAEILVALLLAASGLIASATIAPATADACSLVPVFEVSISDLAAGNAPNYLAHLNEEYHEWQETMYGSPVPARWPAELPALTGAWYEEAIIAVDPPPDVFAGVGGVTIIESVWGGADNSAPRSWILDTSSCAGEFPLPDPGAFRIETDSEVWFPIDLQQPHTPDDVAAARAFFGEAFGAPVHPPRDATAEAAMLEEVLTQAEEFGLENLPEPRIIGVVSGGGNSVDDQTAARKSGSGWLWWVAGSSALVLCMLALVRRSTRAATNDNSAT